MAERSKGTWKERGKAFLDALWALLMPILIVGGMLTGIFTPTEAAVIASLYAFLVGKFVYKELKLKDVLPICGRYSNKPLRLQL